MMKNEGRIDRIVRIIAGLILIGTVFTLPAMNPWGWIGIVPLATGIIGWCPAYSIFGIKTCNAK